MLAPTLLTLSLIVRVYDASGLPAGGLASSEKTLRAILKDAGIAVTWRDCRAGQSRSCQEPLAPNEIIMRISAAPPAGRPDSLGFSFVDADTRSGSLATVFADRVQALWASTGAGSADSGQLLGRAMAHEIVHLLLGTTEHAARGLMRGRWSPRDLRTERPWDWAVPRKDAAQMRHALAARLGQPERQVAVASRQQ